MGCATSSVAPDIVPTPTTSSPNKTNSDIDGIKLHAHNVQDLQQQQDQGSLSQQQQYLQLQTRGDEQKDSAGHVVDNDTGLLYRDVLQSTANGSYSNSDNFEVNLINAIKRGDLQAVSMHLQSSNDGLDASSCNRRSPVSFTGMWDSTPLLIATQYNYFSIAHVILDITIQYSDTENITHRNDKGATALLYTCMWGNSEFLNRLLPYYISDGGDEEIDRLLFDNPSKPLHNDLLDKIDACTPLSIAITNGHISIVNILLSSYSSSSSSSHESLTRHFKFPIKSAYKRVPKATMCSGMSPLMLVMALGHSDILKKLLDLCDKLDSVDDDGRTIYHHFTHAPIDKQSEIFATLQLHQCNSIIDCQDNQHYAPIHYACDSKNLNATELLLNAKANVNNVSAAAGSPLHIVVSKKSIPMVKLIVSRGGDMHALNSSGISPYMIAQSQPDGNIIAVLNEFVEESKKGLQRNNCTESYAALFLEEACVDIRPAEVAECVPHQSIPCTPISPSSVAPLIQTPLRRRIK